MKKLYKIYALFLFIGAFTIASGTAFAQGSESTGFAPGGKGYRQLNFGIELQGWGIPVYAGMDFGVGEFITIGPRITLETQAESFVWKGMEAKSRSTVVVPSFRGDYHFSGHIKGLPAELDIYGGLTLGFVMLNSKTTYRIDGKLVDEQPTPTRNTQPKLWAQLGARYFFSDNWGVQLEFASYGTDGAVGLTYRF